MSRPSLRRVAPTTPTLIGGLMDKNFPYVVSYKTDIRATFARVRAQLKDTK